MLPFSLKFQSSELLFKYIHHSLASLSVLFKHKSFSFANLSLLSLLFHHVSIFWLEHLYILPKLQGPALKVHVLWCITGIHGWCASCVMIHFQFDSFAIWSISASISSIIAWKAPASSWFPSELVMFLKIDLRCFGSLGKFQDTREISV